MKLLTVLVVVCILLVPSVAPYIKAEVHKAFTSSDNVAGIVLGVDSTLATGAEAEQLETFVEDLLSPFGVTVVFGSEYFISEDFSLGGEFGLRTVFHSAELEGSGTGTSSVEETKISYFDTFVALTVNFRL